jgi:hypothetical protein
MLLHNIFRTRLVGFLELPNTNNLQMQKLETPENLRNTSRLKNNEKDYASFLRFTERH